MTTESRSAPESRVIEPVYSESDPVIWLAVSEYFTARMAEYAAWKGKELPWTFSEEHALRKDLHVKRVWMKSEGPANGYDEWWSECSVTDVADCVEFFRVEWKPSWLAARERRSSRDLQSLPDSSVVSPEQQEGPK